MNGAVIADALVERGLAPAEHDAKRALFDRVLDAIGPGATQAWWVPGRLEVFGKHTDYAGGRSLVCAVPRGFAVVARPRSDRTVSVIDAARDAAFTTGTDAGEGATGWRRYVATVVHRLARNFPEATAGADIVLASDLPPASGMSSSSALLVGIAAALVRLRALDQHTAWRDNIDTALGASAFYACIENGASYGSLDGDAGVGTHGGSEDHAAIVTATPGELSAFAFVPPRLLGRVGVSGDWSFVIAPSAARAEKTGNAQAQYNRLSAAADALLRLWTMHVGAARSLADTLGARAHAAELHRLIDRATPPGWDAQALHDRLDHFVREDARIPLAMAAFADGDSAALDALSAASQSDADLLLHNQVDETRALAASARECGAFAACGFGAGFGGSVWALAARENATRVAAAWSPHAFVARPAPPLTEFALQS